jgi:CheY-like chemotaxis protein
MTVRVLLADGEPGLTRLYQSALAGDGFSVAVVHDALACLAQLRSSRPDVLVLDPDLPWGQGMGILARMREDPDLPVVPVILLCGAVRPEHHMALAGLLAAECYQKPVPPAQLADRIRLLSSGRSVARGRPVVETAAARRTGDGQSTLRVLIVDDEHDTADSLRLLLRRVGYLAEAVYSAPTALGEARRFRPDVMLCDLGLPGMDGLELAALLRADPATAGIRLIAVSGYGQEEDVRRSLEAGYELHLTKPVDPADWPRFLDGHRSAAEYPPPKSRVDEQEGLVSRKPLQERGHSPGSA